jgi:hypothetical protein
MRLIDSIISGDYSKIKSIVEQRFSEIVSEKMKTLKEEVKKEFMSEDNLIEATRNNNIVKMGRVQKIRRRIRRNAKGRIVVQRNRKRSGIKGYRVSGNTVKRISATERLRKARLLKRSWKTTRRAKLRRTLIKRKMSMRRRASMGLK